MNEHIGEKTEQPTPRRVEEALKRGQIARSPEVQTAFVLLGGLAALVFTGQEIWNQLVGATVRSLGHLHDTPIVGNALQSYAVGGMLVVLKCVAPVLIATCLAGLLAGAVQNRFNTASEALTPDWNRLNPVEGFKRLFSTRTLAPTAISLAKLAVIVALIYSEVRSILTDPIFTTSVSVARMSSFFAETSLRIFLRVSMALLVIAAADYG